MSVQKQAQEGHQSGEATPPRLRIVLADDHAIVREGIKSLVNTQPDMQVVGEAASGRQLYQLVCDQVMEKTPPDVVVTDVSMPDGNGIEATERLRNSYPTIKVVALSMHEDKSYVRSLIAAGAVGYVLKRSVTSELIKAIRAVAGGEQNINTALTETITNSFVNSSDSRSGLRGDSPNASLTEREETVLRLSAKGYAGKEVAVQLKISVKTVETYKARAMEKLSLESRSDLVRHAITHNWLRQTEDKPAPPVDADNPDDVRNMPSRYPV